MANCFDSTCGSKPMDISFFFTKFVKIMTSFHKKYWRYLRNGPMKQISTWHCVLRVPYTNLLILNQLS